MIVASGKARAHVIDERREPRRGRRRTRPPGEELVERLALDVAPVRLLPQPSVDDDVERERGRDVIGRLAGAAERARIDRVHGAFSERRRNRDRERVPVGRQPRVTGAAVRHRMPHEHDRGHGTMLSQPARTSSAHPPSLPLVDARRRRRQWQSTSALVTNCSNELEQVLGLRRSDDADGDLPPVGYAELATKARPRSLLEHRACLRRCTGDSNDGRSCSHSSLSSSVSRASRSSADAGYSSRRRAATNASCGTSTRPICFMRFLPSFWRSSSLRLREMSPP